MSEDAIEYWFRSNTLPWNDEIEDFLDDMGVETVEERSHDQLSRMSVPASFSGFRFLSIQKRHFKIFGANFETYTEKEDREMCLSCNNSF